MEHCMKPILTLILVSAGYLTAAKPGTFSATGSMTSPRTFLTATGLLNIKVLIAAGLVQVLPPSRPLSCTIRPRASFPPPAA